MLSGAGVRRNIVRPEKDNALPDSGGLTQLRSEVVHERLSKLGANNLAAGSSYLLFAPSFGLAVSHSQLLSADELNSKCECRLCQSMAQICWW